MINHDRLKYVEDLLIGKEHYSVMQQIQEALWDAAAFGLLALLPSLMKTDKKVADRISPVVYNLIVRWYSRNQLVTIRRLLDANSSTVSLRKVIERLQVACKGMTRGDYLALHGFSGSVKEIKISYIEFMQQNANKEVIQVPDELGYHRAMELSKRFSRACKIDEARENQEQVLPNSFFSSIYKKLDGFSELQTHTNSYIAHMDNPANLKKLDAEKISVTYGDLKSALEVICRIAFLVSKFFFEMSYSLPGMYMGNLNTDLYSGVAGSEYAEQMEREWDSFWALKMSYGKIDWDWLYSNDGSVD